MANPNPTKPPPRLPVVVRGQRRKDHDRTEDGQRSDTGPDADDVSPEELAARTRRAAAATRLAEFGAMDAALAVLRGEIAPPDLAPETEPARKRRIARVLAGTNAVHLGLMSISPVYDPEIRLRAIAQLEAIRQDDPALADGAIDSLLELDAADAHQQVARLVLAGRLTAAAATAIQKSLDARNDARLRDLYARFVEAEKRHALMAAAPSPQPDAAPAPQPAAASTMPGMPDGIVIVPLPEDDDQSPPEPPTFEEWMKSHGAPSD
ncbi:hypothetical protein [Bosea sp. ANAM02]|uniref:hypothetical protein n=1 Tax=Bosea sp. ANAM02 TaxID=2020412 RepID=UPI00140F1A55|nr:hypothetical protein [Bosea sp. ANAM02]BCB20280.1 hypothetical protein OCUBac02_31740 [Bosea sp. ANAM02]